ncbi:MAG: hypothetical protein ISN28_02965 [Ectothiorhodospiraceae bacterium AqS1]|nr:hypothetical protein [Ectothiorhodospiraceae bacterium AqS1]
MLPSSEWRRPFFRRSWLFASLGLTVAIALALGAAWHVHRRSQSLAMAQERLVDLRTEQASLEFLAAEEDRLAPSFRSFEAKGLIRREDEGEWLEEMRLALASEPLVLSPVIVSDEEAIEREGEPSERRGVRVERVDAGMEERFLHEEALFAFFRRLRSKVGLPVSVTRCRVERKKPFNEVSEVGFDRQGHPLAPEPLLEVACRLRWTKVVIPLIDPSLRPPGVRQAVFDAGSFSIAAISDSKSAGALEPTTLQPLPLDAFDRLLTTRTERDRLDRMRLSSALAAMRKVEPVSPAPVEESMPSIESLFEPLFEAIEPLEIPEGVFDLMEPEPAVFDEDPVDEPFIDEPLVDEAIAEETAFRPRHFGGIVSRSGEPRWVWIDGQRFEVDLLPPEAIAITDPHPAIRLRTGDRWVELLPGQTIDPITGDASAPLAPD